MLIEQKAFCAGPLILAVLCEIAGDSGNEVSDLESKYTHTHTNMQKRVVLALATPDCFPVISATSVYYKHTQGCLSQVNSPIYLQHIITHTHTHVELN